MELTEVSEGTEITTKELRERGRTEDQRQERRGPEFEDAGAADERIPSSKASRSRENMIFVIEQA
jgi:hypothetical protein